MKKILIILLTMSIFLCGCDNTIYHWEFKKPVSEVKQISIVNLDEYSIYDIEDINELLPLKVLDNSCINDIYAEITALEMISYLLPGMEPLRPRGNCFLIDYGNNKDYCIISSNINGYLYYKEEKSSLYFRASYRHCRNVEDFEYLLNKYLYS